MRSFNRNLRPDSKRTNLYGRSIFIVPAIVQLCVPYLRQNGDGEGLERVLHKRSTGFQVSLVIVHFDGNRGDFDQRESSSAVVRVYEITVTGRKAPLLFRFWTISIKYYYSPYIVRKGRELCRLGRFASVISLAFVESELIRQDVTVLTLAEYIHKQSLLHFKRRATVNSTLHPRGRYGVGQITRDPWSFRINAAKRVACKAAGQSEAG